MIVGTPFGDGYADGLYGKTDHAYLYPEGRAREKYVDGVRIGAEEREAGALEPVEALT